MYRSVHWLSIAVWSLVLLCPAADLAIAGSVSQDSSGTALRTQQGKYFRWSAPPGWRVSETIAGVTLTSPDGRYSASLAGLMRSRGSSTPAGFLRNMYALVPDFKNLKILSVKNLPNQRMGYQEWRFIEARVSYTDRGMPVTGVLKCGVANYYGMYDGLIVGYRAADADFQRAQSFMPAIAKSIVLTNANAAFGNNTLIQPKNNPNTSGDTIMKTWENKNKSQDKSMQKWSNSMRGNEPTFDPATGQRYSTPQNSWNAAKGGYVNPKRPTELLQCGTPEDPHPCGQ